ncbi:MAG: PRD domain-containing protein [Sphaerochaetaceae bacterium]|nr:PRD domain-containing protein [Sphaerochaetaceae bacterium]
MRHCACPQSIEIGLALHIQAIIEGRAPGLKIDDGEYEQFRLANPDLFSTAELLSSSLKENLGLAIDRNEKFVIATFIKDGMQESSSDDHPAILITMLGEGTAESYAAALCRLSMTDGIYGCSFPIGMDDSSIRERARKKLLEISRGKGIVVFYDMDNLRTQTEIAADELGIEAVFVRNGITDRIMDMARRARFAHKASSLANASDPSIASERTQAIITLCETGTGGAVAIAEHIRKYGKLNDTQVIELGILDRSVLREKVGELRKKYRIALIIGAFDPKLFGIPWISVSELFSTEPALLPLLLKGHGALMSEKLADDNVYEYLGQQLNKVSIPKLRRLLPQVIVSINEMTELSPDQGLGLLLHIACVIENQKAGKPGALNPETEEICRRFPQMFSRIRGLMSGMENEFSVKLTDDDIATIVAIVMKYSKEDN